MIEYSVEYMYLLLVTLLTYLKKDHAIEQVNI